MVILIISGYSPTIGRALHNYFFHPHRGIKGTLIKRGTCKMHENEVRSGLNTNRAVGWKCFPRYRWRRRWQWWYAKYNQGEVDTFEEGNTGPLRGLSARLPPNSTRRSESHRPCPCPLRPAGRAGRAGKSFPMWGEKKGHA